MAERYKVQLNRIDRLYCWGQAAMSLASEALIFAGAGVAVLATALTDQAKVNAILFGLTCESTGLLVLVIRLAWKCREIEKTASIPIRIVKRKTDDE